jgi:hypothetical protein
MLLHLVTDILQLPDSPKGENTLGSRNYTLKRWEDGTLLYIRHCETPVFFWRRSNPFLGRKNPEKQGIASGRTPSQ